MSLNIILGKPKTGKSCYIYDQIEKDIEKNREVILFVPSQQRLETENKYMYTLKKPGIIGVNITTISEYIKDNITRLGIYTDDKYISKQDKKMILADVISKLDLSVFKSVSKKEGFLELIYIYIDLLRKSDFDFKALDKLDIKNKLVHEKLKEICKIYEVYLNEVKDKFVDSIDETAMFLNNISKLDFSNTCIYIDSYNNFTESEFKVINSLMNLSKNVSVSLTTDISKIEDIYSDNTNEIFEVANLTYKRLINIANTLGVSVHTKLMYIKKIQQNDDIEYLAENIFYNNKIKIKDTKNIHINLYSNNFDEIQSIAKVINKKIREGYRYRDFDIYTTNVDKYKNILERIFFDTKIPVYINSEENIIFSKLTLYILKYLELLKNGVKKDIILDILKLGFSKISPSDIYEFENYILEFNINDYYITKSFKLNNKKSNDHIYDLDKLNEIRKYLIDLYDINIPKEETSKYYIKTIYEHLAKNVFDKYNEALLFLENSTNEFDISNFNKEKQVWDKICEVFNSISKIYKEKISFDKFVMVFKLAMKDTALKSAPPVLDSVNLLDINTVKEKESNIAFFVGVNENEFPKIVEEDIIFSDVQLNSLKESDITLKETTVSKQNMSKYNIYKTINSIKEELYISIPTSDYSGKTLKPSSVINDIKQVINVKINSEFLKEDKKNIEEIYSKKEMLEYMLENISKSKDFEEVFNIYEYIKEDSVYNELLSYKKNDENLKDETLNLIYNDKFNTSVSKLELFKKCPFSYYMKYLLKIEPRREFEISSLDIGSFMHEVLEKFSKYLFSNNITWQTLLTENSWEEKLYDIIEEKLELELGNKKQSIKYGILKEKLINTMKKVIIVIANSFNQSEFVPFGYEIEFKEGSVFAPIKIKLDEDKTMNIIGKIDRVDVLKLEDEMYVRIVDYKSSKKDLRLEDVKEGISLQLVTYLSSFINNMKKDNSNILPAGMLYFNLSDKLVNLKDYQNDEEKIKNETIKALRMKGIFLKDIKIIEKMDNKLTTDKRLIDISKITLNKENTNKALNLVEYEKLFEETKLILKNIGQEVITGVVKIRPNKKTDYCKFCNYSSICRKENCV